MINSEKERFEAAKMAYESQWKEIIFRREKEHKATRDILAFFGALAFLIHYNSGRFQGCILLILIGFIIVITILGIVFVLKNAGNHNRAARVIADLGVFFEFFENDKYSKGNTLFPPNWRQWGTEGVGMKGWIYHVIFIIIVGVMLICFAILKNLQIT